MHSIPAALLDSASPAFTRFCPALLSAISFEMSGLLVLAVALVYLWLTVRQLRETVRAIENRLVLPEPVQVLPVPVPAPPAARVSSEPEGIDEGVLVAIAAAVAVVFKHPHRIIAVQPDPGTQHAWSSEGRRELYHSHRIR
jgi:hypothetical protein